MRFGVWCMLIDVLEKCVYVYRQRSALLKVNFNTRKPIGKGPSVSALDSTLKICPWSASIFRDNYFFPVRCLCQFLFLVHVDLVFHSL